MKMTSRINQTMRAVPILIAAGLVGSYTAPAQAIATYDAEITATMTFTDVPDFLILFSPDPIDPIINDPDGPGMSTTADAGGSVVDLGNGFTANAFANGSAAGNPGPASSDSTASVSGSIVNLGAVAGTVTATVIGDWFISATADNLFESANAGVLLDLSFTTDPDPLVGQTISADATNPTVSAPDGADLAVQLSADQILFDGQAGSFDITVDASQQVFFTFELRASGDATSVAVPEPSTLALLALGFFSLLSASRRGKIGGSYRLASIHPQIYLTRHEIDQL